MLRETGQAVAVKVQRPAVLETVSKDLYVLRRAAEVYQARERPETSEREAISDSRDSPDRF